MIRFRELGGGPRIGAESGEGIVYLVGAGPGDPGLITVRGLECLRRADVVVYDRLASEALLEEARSGARLIFAGKSPGRQALGQEQINRLLVEGARAGEIVVRLKGGDPFVFGRGGEEAEACARAGVRWEVVPGVSSAIGVPARAGIPLTHRGLAGSFAVVTAHRACDDDDRVDWAALARIDTVVILMGVERLARVCARLLAQGRSPATPAAVVERGTHPDERVVAGTLAEIAALAKRAGVRSPATIVIGDVVRLREALTRGPDPRARVADPGWSAAERRLNFTSRPERRPGRRARPVPVAPG